MKKNKSKTTIMIHSIILFILSIIMVASIYVKNYYANETVEEFLFYITNGAINGNMAMYTDAIKTSLPLLILFFIFLLSLYHNFLNNKEIILKIKKFKVKLYPIDYFNKHYISSTIIIGLAILLVGANNVKLYDFFINNITSSSFIEENYVLETESIEFKEKKNLIYIVVESLETSMFTKEQGGIWDYEVIPELYSLLHEEDSVFFSANELSTGMYAQTSGGWTTAGIISNHTGVPFKIPLFGNYYKKDDFMKNSYALGDLLKDNGYTNELISGAKTSFGGLEEFYKKHGSYNIIDIDSLSQNELTMTQSDKGPWGLNDRYLFNIAKERLIKLSSKNEPFNLTMITIDTHPNNGYVGEYTSKQYNIQYDNVYKTTSGLIYEFVSWIKEQTFYKNTTIVIVGDHHNMQTEYFRNRNANRYIYNVIINSSVKTDNTKNRIFTAVDMYPTIVASIGCNIKDNQLGLGINLFSDKQTLSEKYGIKTFNKSLEKNSPFYNKNIL